MKKYLPNHKLYDYSGTLFYGEPAYDRFLREDKQISYLLEHQFNDTWSVTQSARHSNIFTSMKDMDVNSVTDGIASRTTNYYKSDLSADLIDTHFTAKWSGGASAS